jgi:succinate dehydrogenase / fumarate reductase cytochrome b subunit
MAEPTRSQGARRPRPLSPHLSIYRNEITMVMSIVHRITGMGLYLGTLLVAWWLIAAAVGPSYYEFVQGIIHSWFGRLVLLGYTWALMHHMLGGVRHLIWDTGRAFDIPSTNRLAWATLGGSIVLTIAIWFFILARGF